MERRLPTPFFDALLGRHPEWRDIPLCPAHSNPQSGVILIVPAPPRFDLACGLRIEDDEGEITIGLDHGHTHLSWPPYFENALSNPIWGDPLAFTDAVLTEEVVASSGWIDGQLRVGSLHEATEVPDLLVPKLQHLRVRSWLGTFNRDQSLTGEQAHNQK